MADPRRRGPLDRHDGIRSRGDVSPDERAVLDAAASIGGRGGDLSARGIGAVAGLPPHRVERLRARLDDRGLWPHGMPVRGRQKGDRPDIEDTDEAARVRMDGLIAERAAEVRAGWDEAEREERFGRPVEVRRVRVSRGRR